MTKGSKDVVHQKIESLRRCLLRIASKTPSSAKTLANDFDLQDIITVNLERAVQSCVDVASHVLAEIDAASPPAESMGESFLKLSRESVISAQTAERMKKAVSFRNILVHEYTEIDWNIVFKVATVHLEDFRSFAKEVSLWMDKGIRAGKKPRSPRKRAR